jgi:hypothetical protein
MLFAIASTFLISPLNLSSLAGAVVAGAAGAGAVVAAFGGAAAMAPDTKATKLSMTTNRIVFFIQFTSLLMKSAMIRAKEVPKKGRG